MQLDPATGTIVPVIDRPRLQRFLGVNDLLFARNGDLYFTDQGQTGMHDPTGRVYRLRVNGQLDQVLDNVPSPNGLALNAAENVLFVAVTRANCVWRVRLLPDGSATKVGLFVQLSGGLAGPDGLALNVDEGLTIAHAGYGVVWICNQLGDRIVAVRSPAGIYTTNVAYGGADMKDLYITESYSGTILRARVDVAGAPLFSHDD
jgi:gluconolactonase